jgi:hypothetical protein
MNDLIFGTVLMGLFARIELRVQIELRMSQMRNQICSQVAQKMEKMIVKKRMLLVVDLSEVMWIGEYVVGLKMVSLVEI